MSGSTAANEATKVRSHPFIAAVILIIGTALLGLGLAVSISVGAADIKLRTVWEAVVHFNPDITQQQIIHQLRLPRALAGALVGACFAVAGAMMQGMTRNPLASPGLLGINAGSAFALAVCFAFYPGIQFKFLILFSFAGAALSAGIVYGIGSLAKGGLTPVRLVLAGVAVSALLSAFSEGIAIYYQIGQDLAFWFAGGVAGTNWTQIQIMLPWMIGGLIGALILSRSITVLSLGEEVAAGLGHRTVQVKAAGTVIVLILAGTAVSVVGPVGFVGLVIPHVARFLVGVDYRWIIPCSAVLGALLMVVADIGARMVNPPFETPIGAITALVGVPFFLYLARKERREW
ncbi:iron ABC transporter permease [Paenibacillus sp. sptzw28]|uniref:FecCD family ABC transporter permease n=1 Tax=Paenibacillus sp. sptzw28 TaxID=715179 RepID=UPI001C6E1DCB|nr:iron ABC transporter permease [Paenibacillus sp. sptzw28]QYR21279.1 iron ABC transporter permease [Paenibacillus sp. sptzw28]